MAPCAQGSRVEPLAGAPPHRAQTTRDDPTMPMGRPRRAATVRADPSFLPAPPRRARTSRAERTLREPAKRAPGRR
jgi:hypothetical protein